MTLILEYTDQEATIMDQHFSDDSSTALGLSHRLTDGGIRRRFDADDADLAAAKRRVGREAPDKAERTSTPYERALCVYLDQGHDIATAERLAADQEAAEKAARSKKSDYLGASVTSLMSASDAGAHGRGSKSKRYGSSRRGTKICPTCHLEIKTCGHFGGDDGRSMFVGARVSARVRDALTRREDGMCAGQIVERVVQIALDNRIPMSGLGVILATLATTLASTTAHASFDDAGQEAV